MKAIEDLYKNLEDSLKVVEKLDFNPYYRTISTGVDGIVKIDGEEFINLASNNYLGLANNEQVKQAMIDTIEKYSVVVHGKNIPIGDSYKDDFFKRIDYTGS